MWGPCAWKFLHAVGFTYPHKPTAEDKEHYRIFLEQLKYVLPCSICRNHYKENLKRFPLHSSLGSQEDLSRWLVDVHNSVNEKTGKLSVEYDKVARHYLQNSCELDPLDTELHDAHHRLENLKRFNVSLLVTVVILIILTIALGVSCCKKRKLRG